MTLFLFYFIDVLLYIYIYIHTHTFFPSYSRNRIDSVSFFSFFFSFSSNKLCIPLYLYLSVYSPSPRSTRRSFSSMRETFPRLVSKRIDSMSTRDRQTSRFSTDTRMNFRNFGSQTGWFLQLSHSCVTRKLPGSSPGLSPRLKPFRYLELIFHSVIFIRSFCETLYDMYIYIFWT